MKKKITLLLIAFILLFALSGCAQEPSPAQSGEGAGQESPVVQEIGEGSTSFRFEVTNDSGELSVWNVSTDDVTVGDALLGVGLVDGDVTDFGLFVLEVDGIVADFNVDGAFWAFYIDGEMAMVGVDQTEIEEGVVYAFVYTAD